MAYKLICIDMDGTLLNDQGEITQENRKALKEAYDAGCIIALTTGRNFKAASLFGRMIGIEGPIIASNGARIGTPQEQEPIVRSILPVHLIHEVIKVHKSYGLRTYFMTEWGIITPSELEESHPYKKMNKTLSKEDQIQVIEVASLEEGANQYSEDILKIISFEKDPEKLKAFRKELEKITGLEVVSSGHENIEIMSAGVTKGSAVKKLAAYLGIQLENVMCLGDSENDLSMLEIAGLAVAMGNGIERVKRTAHVITDTNNHSGVAKAIRKYVLEEA